MGTFLLGFVSIVILDLVLSGDNAVVIAMAAKDLPAPLRKKAIVWGSLLAIILRVTLITVATFLLQVPLLKSLGGLFLVWIAIKLLVKEEEAETDSASDSLRKAIKTIIVADLIMSLDNIIAIAAAARGNFPLLIIGLALSIPLMIFGSQLILYLMTKWPVIIYIGAGILGWTAGEMLITDPLLVKWVFHSWGQFHYAVPAALTIFVIAVGLYLRHPQRIKIG